MADLRDRDSEMVDVQIKIDEEVARSLEFEIEKPP